MIRVVIADDHEMFREMLRLALPRTGDIEVVGEAADGEELRTVVDRVRPDVVLLDYKMPHVPNFAALIRRIRSLEPPAEVVVLSGLSSTDLALHAARGGACAYVLKSTRLAAVADAARTAARGGIWIDPHLDRKVFEVFQRAVDRRANGRESGAPTLTRRESEVLACVADGSSNYDIAQKLCISERTVKTHLTRIFAKLQVKNRLGAALSFYGRPGGNGGNGTLLQSAVREERARG